jgi:glycolate oxidase iron-sulfur subunit
MSAHISSGLDACTRCGLCLQACPTYRDLRTEADSPRGRVFAIKRVADGEARVDATLAEHLYVCLGCRACETACPSGVPFGKILEFGRHEVEHAGIVSKERIGWRAFRRVAFDWVLPNRAAFWLSLAPARALQRAPRLLALLRALPIGARFRRLLSMLPLDTGRDPHRVPSFSPAQGGRRARVGVFVGCVMGELFGGVHASLVRVLRQNGCDVVAPARQWCCGALNLHAGERRHARAMARRNIDAFEQTDVEAIVVDSAGCGAEMKSYGELLADDESYASRAAAFAAKVKDASEFLAGIGLRDGLGAVRARVTYQDACHLAHGQRIREDPRTLLRAIPGLEFIEMQESDRCCGAAGVYSLTRPEMSARILAEKMARIDATGADTVVVTNPGCHMQLLAGAAAGGRRMRVRHLVEMLDEAYLAGASAGASATS